jgi:hypothetical protein
VECGRNVCRLSCRIRSTSFVTKKDEPFAGQLEVRLSLPLSLTVPHYRMLIPFLSLQRALEAGESIAKLGSSAARPQKLRKAFESRSDIRLRVREGGRHNKNFNPFRKRVPKDQKRSAKSTTMRRKGPNVKSKKFEHLLRAQEAKQRKEDRRDRKKK